MAKEFNVPPVIFPSGNNPNPNPTTQRNRPATAPFQPPRSSNPSSLPFMSFDIGSIATSLPPSNYGPSSTVIGGGGYGGHGGRFEDEPPLLEELGGMVIYAVTGFFVVWSTRVCTRLLVELASCGDEHRGLIAYACFLIYVLFSLLVVF
ncbi:hypothetical protein POM88_002281 [Heracleum sosnowskyi]|uniref:Uncharacterized protein n=1 Tax=Heracleum sosnowskyi TaxID=360622 RepID=A0AAD8NBM7_9APIA|nr:hypothetical protein POM88_002281 [Heracleum sosnowskyi]